MNLANSQTPRNRRVRIRNYYISISYFVLFAIFVVKCLFRFRLRRNRAEYSFTVNPDEPNFLGRADILIQME
jgi:hypothetical protein